MVSTYHSATHEGWWERQGRRLRSLCVSTWRTSCCICRWQRNRNAKWYLTLVYKQVT